jgi:hypothetical protein
VGNWGSVASVILSLDVTGPASSSVTVTPNPSNGTVSVNLTANASDTATGNSNIAAAEYFIGATGAPGTGTAMTVNSAAPTAGLSATISAATVNALAEGSYTVSVRSQDALGNWGGFATATLNVDKTAPTAGSLSASPSANNGSTPFNTSTPAVRFFATFTDAATGNSAIAAGEGFIDTVGTTGTGFVFVAADGVFNSPSEPSYADVPLVVINALTTGNHSIFFHAKDAAGNWGTTSTLTYLIDRTVPTFTSVTVAPSPTMGATTVTLTVLGATDPLTGGLSSGVTGGEYWFGTTNPAAGSGTAFTGLTPSIDISALATGTYTLRVRVRDAAGNWSTTINQTTLVVVPNTIFADGFEAGNTNAWSSRSTNTTSRLNVTAGAALVGTRGLQAQGNAANYVQYNFGTAAQPATATYDARFYFRPNGQSSGGKDIFTAATASNFSSVVFRVRYRLSGGTPQVQIQLGGTANGTWTNLLGGTSNNVIEVVWQAAGSGGPNPGTLVLYLNGVSVQTINTTTVTSSIGAIRMGSVTGSGNNTLMFFDQFASKRLTTPLLGN